MKMRKTYKTRMEGVYAQLKTIRLTIFPRKKIL